MKRREALRAPLLCVLVALAACGGAEPDAAMPASALAPSAQPAASESAAANAAPPGMKAVEIPKVGLVGFATTAGSVEQDKVVHAGGFTAQVHPPIEMDPTDIEGARSEAEKLLTNAKTKDEKLPDGFMVTGDGNGAFYGYVYRVFKGKPIVCEATDLDAAPRDAGMAFCKTLRLK